MIVTLQQFDGILEDGTAAEKDSVYNRIASASIDELAPLIRETDDVGRTALLSAASWDEVRFFRLLVERGANHNARDKMGSTTLMVAAECSFETVVYLLQELEYQAINTQDRNGNTALYHGINHLPALELLLQHKADPNITNKFGLVPLLEAASRGYNESAGLLKEYGAVVDVTCHLKRNAMHYAALRGKACIIKWLFAVGARYMMLAEDIERRTPLDCAITKKQQREINFLLKGYKDMVASHEGDVCLHWILRTAVYKSGKIVLPVATLKLEHMLALLAWFVSGQSNVISALDENRALPLHTACRNAKTPIQLIQFLVEQNPCAILHEDSHGNLPIHTICASHPPLYTVEFLTSSHKTSITALNREGCSPFMVACVASASLDVILWLLKVNSDAEISRLRRS